MLPDEHLRWLQRDCQIDVREYYPLPGGKNNHTLKINSASASYVLKCYQPEAEENWIRETQFLELMQRFELETIPHVVALDKCKLLVLYRYIAGKPYSEVCSDISMDSVWQVANFIKRINQPAVHNAARALGRARGSMFNIQDLLNDIDTRLNRLMRQEIHTDEDQDCREFLIKQLQPVTEELRAKLVARYAPEYEFQTCLSPSDIGFHNCLVADVLYFLDFEYAGWDGLEKLISDFFAQPRFEPRLSALPEFLQKIARPGEAESLSNTVLHIMPLVHVKWALIFLNEFTANGLKRRHYSQRVEVDAAQKVLQLNKAKMRLTKAQELAGTLNG